jgi:outer membrane lipoprotein-sorting protein
MWRTAPVAAGLLFAAGVYAQDARQILQKVQETYLNMTSGSFQAVRTSDTLMSGSHDVKNETKIEIDVAKPNKVKVEYDYPGGGGEWIRVSDGKTFSGFRELTHERKQSPASKDDLNILDGTFVDRFEQINDNVESAKVTGSEALDVGGKRDCYVIEVTYKPRPLPEGEKQLPTKYWIDKARYLVLQEVAEATSRSISGKTDVTNRRTLSFVAADVNSPVPDKLFAFNPPHRR